MTKSPNAGDKMEILYSPRNPSRFILDSWTEHIALTIIISTLIIAKIIYER
jgi:hypothetical protein